MKSVIFIFIFLFQVIAIGSPSIAESELSTMTTEPKYAVRVNDLQSPAEAEKVTKIICNGKMVQLFFFKLLCLDWSWDFYHNLLRRSLEFQDTS